MVVLGGMMMQVKDVAITGDNSRFASVGGDRMFFLWEVQSAQVIRRFPGHLHTINTVAFNQVGRVRLTHSLTHAYCRST